MAKKQTIKLNEARIIVFIKNAVEPQFMRSISTKLNIDYGYLIQLIASMKEKSWIKKTSKSGKTYIDLASKAPIEKSLELLANRI